MFHLTFVVNSLCIVHYCIFTDIFTQLSDSSGYLVRQRFEDYLKDLLTLPTAVFEGPSFGYNEMASRACFDNVREMLL